MSGNALRKAKNKNANFQPEFLRVPDVNTQDTNCNLPNGDRNIADPSMPAVYK